MDEKINNKNYSIPQILDKFQICIPIIQREYIQGIKNKNGKVKESTSRLINDILESLNKNKKISLNIVYGFHDNQTFYPVDGQQRLTLLYLLHWYITIRAGKFDDFLKLKSFSYETRVSANEFFGFLRNSSPDMWENLFNEVKKTNQSLIENIREKTWFKIQWASDITIISALNILEILLEKIEKDIAISYYKNLKEDTSKLSFDVISEIKEEAEYDANINYVRLNSRGKQLEKFENAKAILSVIEEKMGKENLNKFTYKYDQKYIDIFYEESKGSLEEKTKQINEKTIVFLKNCYQIWSFVYSYKHSQIQVKDFNGYYSEIFKVSKQSGEVSCFWKEYFEFIDIIMESIYEDNTILPYLKNIWKEEVLYNKNSQDNSNLIVYLFYIYFYYKSQTKYAKLINLNQLEYILLNLNYSKVKQENFNVTETICKEISTEKEVFDYFTKREYNDIIKSFLKDEDVYSKLGINDFKVRIKEQTIKAKIIVLIKETPELSCFLKEPDYKFFSRLEEKSGKRQIYYFFHISDMWDNKITIEKVSLLLDYMNKVEKYHFKNSLKWKKWFAIATYYDEINKKLKAIEEINKEANYIYVRYIDKDRKKYEPLSNENLHIWKSEYYFIDDNMDNDYFLLSIYKLNNLKKAYNILKNLDTDKSEEDWLRVTFDKVYNECWLKYAVDREYGELLTSKISYDSNDNKLNIAVDLKNTWRNVVTESGDFFAYVYALDKRSENWMVNRHFSSTYDIKSKNVRETMHQEKYTLYDELSNNLNQFELNLLWQDEMVYDYDGRRYFYYRHDIKFLGDKKTLIAVEKGVIKLKYFEMNKYDEFEYDISKEKKYIVESIEKFRSIGSSIQSKCTSYNKNNNNLDQLRQDINSIIEESFSCCNSYTKNYEYIRKYLQKKPLNLEIKKDKFTKVNEGMPRTLNFIGIFNGL